MTQSELSRPFCAAKPVMSPPAHGGSPGCGFDMHDPVSVRKKS